MNTTREFQDMLNEYLPNKLLKEELIPRDYILSNCQKDNSWKGGKVIVPFKGTGASSIRMGQLTGNSDIAQSKYVRGSLDNYVEAWGSLIFEHTDLVQHDGKIPETTFLTILEDNMEDFMDYMKMVVSIQLGTGPHFATATADGTAGGLLEVDRVDRFCIRQKVTLKGTVAAAASFYVIAINMNTNIVTFSATRGGAPADISAYTVADNAQCFTDGADTSAFASARSALLSAANGGNATLHGVSKLAYPYLQAINIDGSTWTSANVLDKLFDAYTEVRKKARGKATEIIMSYTIGGAVMKAIENRATATANHNVSVVDKKASLYGWDEILLTTIKGTLKIVMIQEWDDDVVWYRDPKSHTFRTNGYFRKRKAPDGREWYEIRAESGYSYIVDTCLYGEMEWTKPANNGIVYGIDPANF